MWLVSSGLPSVTCAQGDVSSLWQCSEDLGLSWGYHQSPSLRALESSIICWGEAERTKALTCHWPEQGHTTASECRGGGGMCCGVIQRKEQRRLVDNWGDSATSTNACGHVWQWSDRWVIATRVRKTRTDFYCSKEGRDPGLCIKIQNRCSVSSLSPHFSFASVSVFISPY